MDWPKISIVTPSLNQVAFIEQTICSVLDQNYPNLEYIIIDGGSTDGTLGTIKKYQQYLTYWVSEPDEGQTQAINKGFRICTGDLVAWQNSDDYYLPGAFSRVAQVYQIHEADVYFGHKYNVDEAGRIIRPQCYTPFSLRVHLYEGMALANHSAFWRRELFDRLGYLDESLHYAMDYEFFLRLGLNNSKFQLVNDYLVCFRLHGGTKSVEQSHEWNAELARVRQRYGIRRPAKAMNIAISGLFRTFHYLRQGNFRYVFGGVARRLKLGGNSSSIEGA